MPKPRLLLARRPPAAVLARAEAIFDCLAHFDADGPGMVASAAAHRAEAVLLATNLTLDAATIAALPGHVRMIGSFGVGFDHIDVPAAKARGLIVTNTPDVVTDCTADTTMLLILGACRRAGEYEALMRRGWREAIGDRLGRKVSGKTLGILGLGRIGRAVAQRARGFGMRIVYHDMARLPPAQEQGATFFPTLEAMLPHCDILSIHANLAPATTGIINDRTLALLPKGAVFVNAARGGFVDEDALIRALQSGHLFAAGLDVFAVEPAFDLRFRDLPNTFLLPHAGTATVETREAMGMKVLDNIEAVCAGRPPIDPLWT